MSSTKWSIDRSHSVVTFTARHMVVAKVRGHFASWTATVAIDEADLTKSSVEAHIDAASIDTREPKRDEHLRSADFLDVARFPELIFNSKTIQRTSGDHYEMKGELTIRDVSREVALSVRYGGLMKDPWGQQRAVFTAEASIDRKDFGLVWNVALEAGGVLVGDKISIEIELEAVKSA